jgi:adenosylmethionine-8-amino-7-oxononanoate aminotransferase
VLLRPLGDVVVIMPPLTTTAEEIVQIVDALSGGLDDLHDLDRTGDLDAST